MKVPAGLVVTGWKLRESFAAPVMEIMTQLNALNPARGERGGYKVDVSRGERIGRVSSEWFSRPADERHPSLSDLFGAARGRAERSRTRTAESAAIRVNAKHEDAERLALMLPGEDVPLVPTHWSFGQLASLVGAPASRSCHAFTSAQRRHCEYAHLQAGSLKVRTGDQVTRGQSIAKAGSSGTTGGPHVHFQVMYRPSILFADGLPYVFDAFALTGQTPPLAEVLPYYDTLKPIPVTSEYVGFRRDMLPMERDIVTFPAHP